MPNFQIAASLLSADFSRLGEEAQLVIKSGADRLHLDIMDNHFVPNLTVGPIVCDALRRFGILADINVHLMVQPIERLINECAKAGATGITFHAEATDDIVTNLELIRKLGCKAGLALKPETPLACLEKLLDKLDFILVMSVNPGFGGQTFIPSSLKRISQVKKMITASKKKIDIGVDGGIKIENIAQVAKAGANIFVAGSAIFNHADYALVISQMRHELSRISD